MNCLDFRRVRLANPTCSGDDVDAHERECVACADFAKSARRFERELHEGFSVAVPEGLAERIARNVRAPRPAAGGTRVAALLLVAAAIAASVFFWLRVPSIEAAALEHVAMEPKALAAAESDDAFERARTSLEPLHLAAALGDARVHYADICEVAGAPAHHIVLSTAEGKFTMLVWPNLRRAAPRAERGRGFATVSFEAGPHTVSLVADSVDQSRRAERWLRARLGS